MFRRFKSGLSDLQTHHARPRASSAAALASTAYAPSFFNPSTRADVDGVFASRAIVVDARRRRRRARRVAVVGVAAVIIDVIVRASARRDEVSSDARSRDASSSSVGRAWRRRRARASTASSRTSIWTRFTARWSARCYRAVDTPMTRRWWWCSIIHSKGRRARDARASDDRELRDGFENHSLIAVSYEARARGVKRNMRGGGEGVGADGGCGAGADAAE